MPGWARFRHSFKLGEEMSSRNVPADFKCPKCSAQYKVVRVKEEPQSPNRLVHCKVCKEPLAATDGEDILKYFLTARPRAVRR
jgi:transcription elongation factor Elf1